ncbi:PhzF family phenazine biosynthesis isomerase [Streptomyces sp. SID4919]|uniref:PhzF family phenazine biosynthesis protein n=1 Tax=unclassified Streptomyces TaxID=2593676 RepID=UPI000823E87E|nr:MULTISPECIES: PhzF family phenazine biosynthesis isomerase [unclassified Streptomyces]MYY12268.1 PhzF family phenazine biosynthesis isomerase [Streptomyces sp. SID4919]SCK45555.1 phenazine biosynthesis protein PhzF family [Streptomyces sp. AmelKG-E11A]
MRLRIVDAFTDRPFSGNPAGVVLLEPSEEAAAGTGRFPDDTWLGLVAREVNHPETAFAHRLPPGEDADWALRWFTPTTEVDMCGHATLATAHVLRTTGLIDGPVRFRTRSGVLTAAPNPDGTLTLDFPTAPLGPVTAPEDLSAALGAEPLSVLDTGQLGDLLAEFADEAAVRALAPDLRALALVSERGVIATAPAQDPSAGHDFVSRCFFPRFGIDEDPVTGSAHTALAPFWSARLGRTELTGRQVSPRSGVVHTRLMGDRTLLTGSAVTVVDGELLV